MNPQVFGKEHLIYIGVSVLIAIGAVILTKKYAKTEKSKDIVVKTAAGILLLIILSNRLALVFEHGDPNWLELIHWRSEQFGIGEASHSLHGVTGPFRVASLLGLILSCSQCGGCKSDYLHSG